jgi:hypothetical protein
LLEKKRNWSTTTFPGGCGIYDDMHFCDLPAEALMLIARFTPHPCAVLMNDLYNGDRWFDWLERWEHQRFNLRMHAAEFAYDRDHRKRCRDPIEELAMERRGSLEYMGIYEDEIDYERKRRRTSSG